MKMKRVLSMIGLATAAVAALAGCSSATTAPEPQLSKCVTVLMPNQADTIQAYGQGGREVTLHRVQLLVGDYGRPNDLVYRMPGEDLHLGWPPDESREVPMYLLEGEYTAYGPWHTGDCDPTFRVAVADPLI